MKVIVTLRSEPGNWSSPPIKRLALLLKTCLRSFGFRALDARELPDEGLGDANLLPVEREAMARLEGQ